MTQKQKLANYDFIEAERAKLQLAVFDLMCNSRFPFVDAVRIDRAKEIDSDYPGKCRVSVSRRAMPVYMVESFDDDGKVMSVAFHTEGEIQDQRNNVDCYWRMVRHAMWKISRKVAVA